MKRREAVVVAHSEGRFQVHYRERESWWPWSWTDWGIVLDGTKAALVSLEKAEELCSMAADNGAIYTWGSGWRPIVSACEGGGE